MCACMKSLEFLSWLSWVLGTRKPHDSHGDLQGRFANFFYCFIPKTLWLDHLFNSTNIVILENLFTTMKTINVRASRPCKHIFIVCRCVHYYFILSCTCFIWSRTLHYPGNFLYIYTVTDRNIFFFLVPLPRVELSKPNCKSSSLPSDRKYQKGKSRDN